MTEIPTRGRVGNVRPEQIAQLGARDGREMHGQPIEQRPRLPAHDRQRRPGPDNLGRAEQAKKERSVDIHDLPDGRIRLTGNVWRGAWKRCREVYGSKRSASMQRRRIARCTHRSHGKNTIGLPAVSVGGVIDHYKLTTRTRMIRCQPGDLDRSDAARVLNQSIICVICAICG